MSVKTAVLLICKKQLLKLLVDMEQFWTVESIHAEEDVELQQKIRFLETWAWLGASAYRAGGFLLFASFVYKSLINKSLLLLCWLPDDDSLPYYEIMYVIEVYVVFMVIPLVGGCDSLFAAICMRVAIQFTLLCKALENSIPSDVADEEAEEAFDQNMRKIVDHHQFLLK